MDASAYSTAAMAPPATAISRPLTPAAAVGAAMPGAAVVEMLVLPLCPVTGPEAVVVVAVGWSSLPVKVLVGCEPAEPVAPVALPVMGPGPHEEALGV